MAKKTMQNWELAAKSSRYKKSRKWAERVHTNKNNDMARLEKLVSLPQFDRFNLSYLEFNRANQGLTDFYNFHISRGEGFCVRAIPNQAGLEKGYTREPLQGIWTFEASLNFLSEKIKKGEENLWDVGVTSWVPQIYGGVIIAGVEKGRIVYGEISRNLERLTSGEEDPLASFVFYRSKVGHMENKTIWKVEKDSKAKDFLWRTFREHIARGDSFNPFIWKGYFEFVITQLGEIKFVDYKDNPMYIV